MAGVEAVVVEGDEDVELGKRSPRI